MSIESNHVAPFEENGTSDGVLCARCSASNPAGQDRCGKCQAWLLRNAGAVKTGIYRRTQPFDLRQTADEMIAGIVADNGGIEELSTLERATIRNLADVAVTLRLLMNEMVTGGLLTPGRNVRQVYAQYLAGLDRFDRLGQRIGLKRRQRRVETIDQLLNDEQVTTDQ